MLKIVCILIKRKNISSYILLGPNQANMAGHKITRENMHYGY